MSRNRSHPAPLNPSASASRSLPNPELLDLVEPAVQRATKLRESVVAAPRSEEADRYLDKATRCYFCGLFTACAVMCRSVLEEAVKQKLPAQLARLIRTRYRNAATLGNLLHEVNNNNLQLSGILPDFSAYRQLRQRNRQARRPQWTRL